jgi:hypothetical protein
VNYILRKNRRILLKFVQSGRKKITMGKLAHAGFDFNLITSVKTDHMGQPCYFCYELGYSIEQEGKLKLIQRDIVMRSGMDITGNISG